MKTKILLSTTLFFMFLFIQGQIINIPGDYPTIQEGINAATDGDTVLVQPETYTENINFLGKDITVGSLYLTTEDTIYAEQTIIDGDQNGTSVVTFENEESGEAKLIGFTITNGYSSTSGGGVMCVFSSPSLQYLYITDNEAEYNGGGVICGAFASPSLYHVKIQNNFAGNDGGGIYCYNNCNPSLENVIISENISDHIGGGICCLENCSPGLNQVVIANNDAQQGGGIFCAFNSNLDLQEVAIINNGAPQGGGVFMSENSLTFINTTIANNTATRGGGIFADNFTELSIDSSDISGNIATDRGAGIYSFNSSFYRIQNSFITENQIIGGLGGGITFDIGLGFEERPEVIIENTLIADNFGSESGAIAGVNFYINNNAETGADIFITNCAFENNSSKNSSALNITGEGFSFDIMNCIFSENEADMYCAGAAFTAGCSGSLYNCLFESNIANLENQEWNSGGANTWGGSEVEFFNCTFVDNSAYVGSALAVGYNSEASLVNSIVWDNDSNPIAVIDFNDTGSTLMIGQCDIEGGEASVDVGDLSEVTWVGDNLDEDPLFVGTGDHPFSLDVGSPCIDAGADTTGMELPDSDLLGNYRVWDGDGDQDAVIDMGPYEYGSVGVGIYEAPGEVEQQCTVFPNPFTTSTHIEYELKEPSKVQFSVFNQIGQLVYQHSEEQNQGIQQLTWQAENLPKGIYFYSMQVGDQAANGKIVKVR